MNTNDKLLSGFQRTMKGATHAFRSDLQGKVDDPTYRAVVRTALTVLDNAPKDVPLGTLAAAMILAATAFAEGASQAKTLIEAADQ